MNGATTVMGLTFGRTDNLSITSIGDTVHLRQQPVLGCSAANRLNSASGIYGSQSWTYDGVGNRTSGRSAGSPIPTVILPPAICCRV
ncbi:MAG: hypothetical protein R3D51_17755 [Hyphomicrobiaceae bacterium]